MRGKERSSSVSVRVGSRARLQHWPWDDRMTVDVGLLSRIVRKPRCREPGNWRNSRGELSDEERPRTALKSAVRGGLITRPIDLLSTDCLVPTEA
jgi:hypothetical protein